MAERIEEVNIAQQANEDFTAYAIYVARCRSIPNFVDGLKPVVRRILWCAGSDFKGQGWIKTSRLAGQVIGKYNPHGDAAIPFSIRNMITDYTTKYPAMDGDGSWGHKANPTPSAPRYTDCKISQFGIDVFMADIYDDKRSTDWVPNYDNKFTEPAYLPAKIPTLLILGQVGIAVGMKSAIPSHNLGDVVDTTIKLIKDPNAPFCLIPDECMPCEILETEFDKICETGMGTYIAQGIIDVGQYNNYPALYVRSLPDFTFFDSIKETIIELVDKGKMPYIIDMVSKTKVDKKSTKTNFEEVIILKKGTDPNFVKEFLYANTGIRQTRQVRLIVIKNDKLEMMTYRQYLLEFIKFRRMTIFRRLNAKLQTYKTAIHERELYLKVMTSGEIDNIIQMIKKQDTRDDGVLVEYLVNKLKVTPLQAKFLLGTDIRKLSKGYLKKYQQDLKELTDKLEGIMNILLDSKNIDKLIIDEMTEIKKKYNTPKLCRVISKSEASGIAPGTFKLVFTKKNFIKKIGENESVGFLSNDSVNFIVKVENTENIIVFSTLGKVFKMPVHKIPLSVKNSNGVDIRILNKYATSNICCAARETVLKRLADSKFHNYIFIVSEAGYIKKIDIADVITAPPSGIIFSKLDQGDVIKDILFGPDKMDILIYSGPKVLRISSKEVPYLKRSTKGNRVSTSTSKIDGMNFVHPNSNELIVVTKQGFINRLPLSVIPVSNRGKAGQKVIKLKKDDSIVSIWPCETKAKLIITENFKNTNVIPVDSIPVGSTVGTGTVMCKYPTRVAISYE